MTKYRHRTLHRKGSTFLEVTGNTSKREILTNIKCILTKRIQRTYKVVIHNGED